MSGQACGVVSLRAIARDAGVDAALITHYFGGRAGLLREALRPEAPLSLDFAELLRAGPAATFGERIVAAFVAFLDEHRDAPNPVLTALAMGTDDALATELLEGTVAKQWTRPLTSVLADAGLSPQPELAAQLSATQALALSLMRSCPGMEAIEALAPEDLVVRYGRLMQAALTTGSA